MTKRKRLVGPDGRRDVAKLRELDARVAAHRAARNVARGLLPDGRRDVAKILERIGERRPRESRPDAQWQRDVDKLRKLRKLRKLLEEPRGRDTDHTTG